MLRIFRTIVDFAKKAFLVVGVFYIILAIFGNVINKNRPQYDTKKFIANNQKQIYSVLSDKSLTQTKAGQLKLLLHRLSTCTFMGELCTNTPSDDPKYFKTSLVGQVSSLISLTYVNPPASGVYWVNNTLQNAGLVPNTYAAEGAGFAMIKPLMNLWKIFRDIAYLLIVLVLVAIGFMIMFRMKINPQTVISVENALPRIVVSLLLITFSFAIAGFLIDVMYLLIVLIIGILSNNNTFYDANQMQNTYLQSDFATLWNSIIPIPASMKGFIGIPKFAYIGDAFMALLPEEINVWSHIIASVAGVGFGTYGVVQIYNSSGLSDALNNIVLLGNGLGGALKALFGGVLLVIIPLIVWQLIVHGLGFIIGFIVSLAILGMLFNIFFLLLRSYIQITLSIVFSPIILLFEALPG
ncbi:MAG: hypothetical protein NTZ55_02975, partial [Candidatus Roizmanbacteria bacterium]|nr:hypothetical protein [Candidatus Roizmanbacteria bacterium]